MAGKKHQVLNCPTLKVILFNCRSLGNKTYGVCEFLKENDCDLCFITEAWIKQKHESTIAEICDLGFEIKLQSRKGSKRGGGVCVLYKPDLNVEKCCINTSYKSFEVLQITVKSCCNLYRVSTFYRTGNLTTKSRTTFINDLNDYLESLVHLKGENILCGDFNIHVNEELDLNTTELYSVTSSYGYVQLVKEATHRDGNTLDLMFVQNTGHCKELASKSVYVYDLFYSMTSDHKFIECLIPFSRDPPKPIKEIKSYRNFKAIDVDQFCNDFKRILDSPTIDFFNLDADRAVECFNDALKETLNKHAPLVTKSFVHKRTSFTNPEIIFLRRQRRKYERLYRKYKNPSDLASYNKLVNDVKQSVKRSRNTYYSDNLFKNKGNKRQTFQLFNNMLGKRKTNNTLPDFTSEKDLCTEFETYFTKKVSSIRNDIQSTLSETANFDSAFHYNDGVSTGSLSSFASVTENDFHTILSSLSNKHCPLDIIPTPLFKSCSHQVMPYVMYIINISFSTSKFPTAFKKSIVRPALKNASNDKNVMSNYRPISNMCFLSKIEEKCVLQQLLRHLEGNNLFGEFQSAYRKFHSCETAITKVSNDILVNLDSSSSSFLIFLDLSSAFDLVDHSILLKRLHDQFHIAGNVLQWFKSYLTDRNFSVKIGVSMSDGTIIFYGVPQGSILGPILFLLYISEIESIAKLYGLKIHIFADDMQLYISFQQCDTLECISNIEHCLRHIKVWMSTNFLKINESKTQLMIIAPHSHNVESLSDLCISFGGSMIFPSDEATNLGIKFDKNMSYDSHINSITANGYFYMTNFYRIADKLTFDLKVQLVMTYIIPLIDYCNVIFVSATQFNRNKLQKLLNSAVRFIFNLHGKKRRLSLTPYLKKLHILPVDYRIQYKLCLLVYKCIYGLAPQYLSDLLSAKISYSKLRSSSDLLKLQTETPRLIYGEHTFSNVASNFWNRLPLEVRQSPSVNVFKTSLKTHLFRQCFVLTN